MADDEARVGDSALSASLHNFLYCYITFVKLPAIIKIYFGSLIFYLRRNFLDPVLDPIGRFIREKCRPSGILGDLVDYLVTAFVGALVYTTVVIFLSARIYLVVEAF